MRSIRTLLAALVVALAGVGLWAPTARADTATFVDPQVQACVNAARFQPPTAPVPADWLLGPLSLSCDTPVTNLADFAMLPNLWSLRLSNTALRGRATLPSTMKLTEFWVTDSPALTEVVITGTSVPVLVIRNTGVSHVSMTMAPDYQRVDVTGSAFASLRDFTGATSVTAHAQLVTLPTWTTGTPFPFEHADAAGRPTLLALPEGVTETSEGLVYAKAGTYTFWFNAAGDASQTFYGTITQTVTGPTMPGTPAPAAHPVLALDPDLRVCVNRATESPDDAPVDTLKAAWLTSLHCEPWPEPAVQKPIHSLAGLEYFTGLKSLQLVGLQTGASLSIPALPQLTELLLSGSPATSITLSPGLTSLQQLSLYNHQITGLTIPSTLPATMKVNLEGNRIASMAAVKGLGQRSVRAPAQRVSLPDVKVGVPFAFTTVGIGGRTVTFGNDTVVSHYANGAFTYPAEGTYLTPFTDGGDFYGLISQSATVEPRPTGVRGDHTGDGFADLYGVDSTGRLLFYRGSPTEGATTVGQRGNGWQTMSYLTQVADMNNDGWSDLLARKRADNTLWLYTAGAGGFITASRQIGVGWGGMDTIVPVGNLKGGTTQYLLARETATGYLYRYTITATGTLTGKTRIGHGWTTIRQLLSVGDFTGDGRSDVLAIGHDGLLWLYPGTTSATLGYRKQVGQGWGTFKQAFSAGDLTGDGRADLLGQSATGQVYVYPNRLGTWGTKRQIMFGTQSFLLLA